MQIILGLFDSPGEGEVFIAVSGNVAHYWSLLRVFPIVCVRKAAGKCMTERVTRRKEGNERVGGWRRRFDLPNFVRGLRCSLPRFVLESWGSMCR